MKSLLRVLCLGVLFSSSLAFAIEDDAQYQRCIANLVKGNYCLDSQAEVICNVMSNHAVSCAMDLVDMGQYPDIFGALEYCQFPFPGRTPPGSSAPAR